MTLLSLRTLRGMGGTSYPLTQQGKRCPDHLSPDLRGLTLPLHCIYFYAYPGPWAPGLATSRSWGNAQQAVCKRSLVQDEQDVGGTASAASRAYAGTSQFTRSAASVFSLPQFLSAAAEQSQTQGLVQRKALARCPAGVRAQPHLSGSLAPESSFCCTLSSELVIARPLPFFTGQRRAF